MNGPKTARIATIETRVVGCTGIEFIRLKISFIFIFLN
jgi:hypothetical protein